MSRTIGVERERFIISATSRKIVNAIDILLPEVRKNAVLKGMSESLFGYELFAGQIEDRTPVCDSLLALKNALEANDGILSESAKNVGLDFCFSEFAEKDEIGILEVNPFDGRHQKIWENISQERRLAASRVIATHVHIGVSPGEALNLFSIFFFFWYLNSVRASPAAPSANRQPPAGSYRVITVQSKNLEQI